MIDSIVGIIQEVFSNYVILNYNNIYIKVFCNSLKFSEFLGKEKRVYVSLKFNENLSEIECYGFLTREERELFLKLQKVTGVGSKLALQILSSIDFQELIVEIAKGNVARLEKVKGIGKKTANRIILELKETLKKEFKVAAGADKEKTYEKLEEISLALLSLGYDIDEVNQVLSSEDFSEFSLEDGIKLALKKLSRI
ncbi:Holliday junction branch migration protein RuvA [Anaerocellum danielii]|uniref:Holliday junction branch migration complex subunit RuvA n=1 Tax=Anaerocellum danielii TaxID=1387557 RepID=A0ABZ0U512_9FIRM|nr:Holliday junction branch migration protein RuvA [Caldicellulosiruptor danielii]WPX09813.1 Holliday junction branch migration protein RuvA [Caldicellulosiruptor danielii]